MADTVATQAALIPWTRRHLLGLEDLSANEITAILDSAEAFVDALTRYGRFRPAALAVLEQHRAAGICIIRASSSSSTTAPPKFGIHFSLGPRRSGL